MAVLTVSEFEELGRDQDGRLVQIAKGAPLNTQVITLSGSSQAVSTDFDSRTKFVRLSCDGGCHIAFGDSPTATTSNELLPSGAIEFRALNTDVDGTKVAVIQSA